MNNEKFLTIDSFETYIETLTDTLDSKFTALNHTHDKIESELSSLENRLITLQGVIDGLKLKK